MKYKDIRLEDRPRSTVDRLLHFVLSVETRHCLVRKCRLELSVTDERETNCVAFYELGYQSINQPIINQSTNQ